jgi:hypothetical protein
LSNHQDQDMRKNWWLHGLKFVLFVVVAFAALGAVVGMVRRCGRSASTQEQAP